LQYPGEKGYSSGYPPTSLCTWLAKHAALLKSLRLDGCILAEDREYAAAGVRAAAGVPSMCNAAAAAAAAAASSHPYDRAARFLVAAEATAQGALSMQATLPPQKHAGIILKEPQQPAGVSMLPLQELHFDGLLQGTLLPTISACCRQLTQLDFSNCFDESPPSDFKALHNLQQLRVNCDQVWTEASLCSISGLTKLTKLDAPGLLLCSLQHLPTSLVDVCAGDLGNSHRLEVHDSRCILDLRRLTSLTCLQLGTVKDPQLLPAQLKELHVQNFKWHEGYVQLSQLGTLQLTIRKERHKPDMVALNAWTQLTALKLCIRPQVEWWHEQMSSMSDMCKHLPKFPLVQLQVDDIDVTKKDIEQLGRCTQLTELSLDRVCLEVGVGAVAQQFLQLHGLMRLRLNSVEFDPHPCEPLDYQPLVDAVCQLCLGPLRFVELSQLVLSEQQVLALQAALGSSLAYREGQLISDSSSADCDRDPYEYDDSPSSGEEYEEPA
jgi:hypothetical protein